MRVSSRVRRLALGFAIATAAAAAASVGCTGTTNSARNPDDFSDDKWIEAAVGEMLLKDEVLRDRPIVVECFHGRVTLLGRVHSEEERERALGLPLYVRGVSGDVVDRLEVRPPKKP